MIRFALSAMLGALLWNACAAAQQPPAAAPAAAPAQQGVQPNAPPGAAVKPPPGAAGQAPPGAAGQSITLDLRGALDRARAYNQQFLSAGIAASLAREDRIQARSALYPTLNSITQYIYTQGNGTETGIFVANNGVHVYNEQAVVHADVYAPGKRADYRRTIAAEAAARARQEIAARGLQATVVQSYYAVLTAQRHLENARRSVGEAETFFDITRKQEAGGEVAHADVIKAQLQLQQRQRELLDAENNVEKARLGMGVILFPDYNQSFTVTDDLNGDSTLPALEEVRSKALGASPEVKAAEFSLQAAAHAIRSARAAFLPTLSVDYFFGINANQFAVHNAAGQNNVGSVVEGTLNIPIFNWGSTRSKVRQAELQQQQANLDLTFTKRQMNAAVSTAYLEAQASRAQLDSLRSSLDLSTESLRLTVLRYQSGEATALEVVDSQSTLAQARNAYDDGLVRYRIALANLQSVSGTL